MVEEGRVRPVVALFLSLGGFVALAILGLGMLSLLTDADVVTTAGVGQLPGVLALGAAGVAYLLATWLAIRGGDPSSWALVPIAAAVLLADLLGLALGVLVAEPDLGAAVGAVGRSVVTGFAPIVALSALVAAAGAIAAVRSHRGRPRWPWERR